MESFLNQLSQLTSPDSLSGVTNSQPLGQDLFKDESFSLLNKLKILIILSQKPGETGSGVYLREIASELQKVGHKPYLLAAHYQRLSSIDFSSLPDDQIYTMIFDNGDNSEIADISFPIPGMSLDMPYLHLPFRDLSQTMLEEYCKAWFTKIRTIVREVNPHVIHVNHLWLLPGIARIAAPEIPIVATAHGTDYKLLQDSPRFASIVLPGVQNLDAVMPVSKDVGNQVVESFGVHRNRIRIIGNGHNPYLFRILPKASDESVLKRILDRGQGLPAWTKLVLYVGKFAEYKGVPYLIRAAKIYSRSSQHQILTLIIGDGSMRERHKLENLVKELELEKSVVLPGKLPYHEVSLVMNAADVFVLPSIDEPFGLALLEALACGLRSVAADRAGPAFFVPNELRNMGLATLVKPLRQLQNQQPDPTDEDRYVTDLATAISKQILSQTTEFERQLIADSVKNQTWSARVRDIVEVYSTVSQFRRGNMYVRNESATA